MRQSNSTRPDRRRARTKKMFSEALLSLIDEGSYDDITIQQIADRADLSRATFYLNFSDKDDLLISCLEAIYDELIAAHKRIQLQDLLPDGVPPSLIAFQQAAAMRDMYRIMQRSNAAASLNARVKDYLAGHIRDDMIFVAQTAGVTNFVVPIDVLVEHMASSLMGLIVWWLNHETDYSAEDMASLFHRLNAPAWLNAFDITPDRLK